MIRTVHYYRDCTPVVSRFGARATVAIRTGSLESVRCIEAREGFLRRENRRLRSRPLLKDSEGFVVCDNRGIAKTQAPPCENWKKHRANQWR